MYFSSNDNIDNNDVYSQNNEAVINKWYHYQYKPDTGLQQSCGKKKFDKCQWVDNVC